MFTPSGDIIPPGVKGIPTTSFPVKEEKEGKLVGGHIVKELQTITPSSPLENEVGTISRISKERESLQKIISPAMKEEESLTVLKKEERTYSEQRVEEVREAVIPSSSNTAVFSLETKALSKVTFPIIATAPNILSKEVAAKQHAVETGLSPRQALPGIPSTTALEERMKELNVPGVSISIIQDGKIIWTKGYGELKQAEKLSQVASISKVVTSLTVLSLIEQCQRNSQLGESSGLVGGRNIDLDTDVSEILPDFWKQIDPQGLTKGSDQKVTIRRLLSHTAGISRGNLGDDHNIEAIDQQISQVKQELQILREKKSSSQTPSRESSLNQRLDSLQKLRKETSEKHIPTIDDMLLGKSEEHPVCVGNTPGTLSEYSNPGYTILQKMIATVTKQSFSSVVQERILDPLGMNDSTYSPSIERIIHGNENDGTPILGSYFVMPELAAGGLWSNASDIAKLTVGLQEAISGIRRIIGPELAAEMTTGVSQKGPKLDQQMKTRFLVDYGLGIGVEKKNEHTYLMHDGGFPGFKTLLITNEQGQGAVILTNGEMGDLLIPEIVKSIATTYNWPSGEELQICQPEVSLFCKPEEIAPVPITSPEALISWTDRVKGRYGFWEKNESVGIDPPDHTVDIEFDRETGKVVARLDVGKPNSKGEKLDLIPLGEDVACYLDHHPGPYKACHFSREPDGSLSHDFFGVKHIRHPKIN